VQGEKGAGGGWSAKKIRGTQDKDSDAQAQCSGVQPSCA